MNNDTNPFARADFASQEPASRLTSIPLPALADFATQALLRQKEHAGFKERNIIELSLEGNPGTCRGGRCKVKKFAEVGPIARLRKQLRSLLKLVQSYALWIIGRSTSCIKGE
jgi:hypothetical protein